MFSQSRYQHQVKPDQPKIKTILLETDGTPYAASAFENALHIAKQNESRLVITFCTKSNNGAAPAGFLFKTVEQSYDYGQRVLERLSDEARAAGVEVETVLEKGQSEGGLNELIDKVQPDLVMLGSEHFHSN